MNCERRPCRASRDRCAADGLPAQVSLYPGIDLFFTDAGPDRPPLRQPPGQMLQIHCCRAGQIVWHLEDGSWVCLHPGDISLHAPWAGETLCDVPAGQYRGLAIWIDLRKAAAHPPELLRETDLFSGALWDRICRSRGVTFLAGSEETERILADLYGQPEALRLAYQRIKVLELLLYLVRMEDMEQRWEDPSEQIGVVREIHDHLLLHMEQRITIEELSRQYHLNPTTLKSAFKAVYGTSLAAHIKQHRMEQAANLLRETDLRIAGIAQAVGYDSQSRFAAAFKEVFGMLPSVYRRQNGGRQERPE